MLKFLTRVGLTLFLSSLALILLVKIFAQSALPGGVIQQFRISAQANSGITFQAPVQGLYVFGYAAGGFLTYTPPRNGCNRSASPCYSTFVVGFPGNEVRWSGQDLHFSRTLFRLGEDSIAWSLAETERQTAGQRVSATLARNEQVTLVAGDLRTAYDDNDGEIILNVYLVP